MLTTKTVATDSLGVKGMAGPWPPVIKTLEHLSYVIECVAMDYLGEAKYELECLCLKLESDSEFDFAEGSSCRGAAESA